MSSARFDLPPAGKITLMGGSEMDVGNWLDKNGDTPDTEHDGHYAFRIIRVTVQEDA